MSLSADDMILYLENPKEASRKLLAFVNELGHVEECKINLQISLHSWKDPGEGKGYLLQYSGLENPMHCIVHGVTKSGT